MARSSWVRFSEKRQAKVTISSFGWGSPALGRRYIAALCLGAALLFGQGSATATVPLELPVQGYLQDSEGIAISGTLDLTFALYRGPEGGESFWVEEHFAVDVEQGLFSVYLGSASPLNPGYFVEEDFLWLEVRVNDEALTRVRVGSVPYAVESHRTQQIGQYTGEDLADRLNVACDPGEYLRGWDDTNGNALCASDNDGSAFAEAVSDGDPDTTPVSWSDLVGVPADLADGDDDTVLTESMVDDFVSDNGYAIATDLNDGVASTTPVGWSDLAGVPEGFADGDDRVLTEEEVEAFIADDGYAMASELVDGDPSTTPVGWSDLSGLPPQLDCPADMTAVGAFCIEIDERPTTPTGCNQFLGAHETCAAMGRRLCNTAEWFPACANLSSLNDMAGNWELLADLTSAGSVIVVGGPGCTAISEASCSNPDLNIPVSFRCCL